MLSQCEWQRAHAYLPATVWCLRACDLVRMCVCEFASSCSYSFLLCSVVMHGRVRISGYLHRSGNSPEAYASLIEQFYKKLNGVQVKERKLNSQWANLSGYRGNGTEGDNNENLEKRDWQQMIKTIPTNLTAKQKAQLPGLAREKAKFGRKGLFCQVRSPGCDGGVHSHEKRHTPSEALAAFIQVLASNTVPFSGPLKLPLGTGGTTCLEYYLMTLLYPTGECASGAYPNKSKTSTPCSKSNNSTTLCVPCKERAAIQSDEVKEDVIRWWKNLSQSLPPAAGASSSSSSSAAVVAPVAAAGPPSAVKDHYPAFEPFLRRMYGDARIDSNEMYIGGGMGGGGQSSNSQSLSSGGGGGGGLTKGLGGGKTRGLGGGGGATRSLGGGGRTKGLDGGGDGSSRPLAAGTASLQTNSKFFLCRPFQPSKLGAKKLGGDVDVKSLGEDIPYGSKSMGGGGSQSLGGGWEAKGLGPSGVPPPPPPPPSAAWGGSSRMAYGRTS